jgi:hypothetical protein
MGLGNINVVDAIGLEKNSECAILSLFDSWGWDDEEPAHLLAIQDKFNAYLEFIESGQIFEDYPPARNKDLVIDVIFRFEPTRFCDPPADVRRICCITIKCSRTSSNDS